MEDAKTLQDRLSAQMRKAFFDKLGEDLEKEDPTAADWLINLHHELVMRLSALRPGRKSEIADKMDPDIFGQKIKARAFRGEDMAGMVAFTFEIMREIVAPDMDSDLNRAEQSVVTKMSERNPKFSAFVPLFLSEVHQLLDFTISRIEKMRQDGLVGQTGTPSTE